MAQWSIQPETRRLIFLNETSVKTNMARSHGRAPIAECLVAPVPHGHRHTPSFIGWLSDDGMVAPYVLEGAVNQVRHPTLVIGRDEHDALDRPSLQELP
jgi:hypothetical protein